MTSKTPVFEKLLEPLLNWPQSNLLQVVLCGSAFLAWRGVRDVEDLDVLIPPPLHKLAPDGRCISDPVLSRVISFTETRPPKKEQPRLGIYDPQGRVLVQCEGYDFFDSQPRLSGFLTYDNTLKNAMPMKHGGKMFWVMHPSHCIAVKAMVLRPKDRIDIGNLLRLINGEGISPPDFPGQT